MDSDLAAGVSGKCFCRLKDSLRFRGFNQRKSGSVVDVKIPLDISNLNGVRFS